MWALSDLWALSAAEETTCGLYQLRRNGRHFWEVKGKGANKTKGNCIPGVIVILFQKNFGEIDKILGVRLNVARRRSVLGRLCPPGKTS